MPHDPEAFADMVVTTVKLALGPVLERLAVAEAKLGAIGDVRDRVVAIETKSMAMVTPAEPVIVPSPQPLDVAPLLERLTAAETRLATLGDVRDRVVAMETKAAVTPPPADPGRVDAVTREDLEVRLKTSMAEFLTHYEAAKQTVEKIEARLAAEEAARSTDITDMRLKMTALETTQAIPTAAEIMLTDVKQRLTALETKADPTGPELAALRERVAVVEVKSLVPGPPGKDGRDGKDGIDGVQLGELAIVPGDDDRTIKVVGMRDGLQVKDFGALTFPVDIYRGVYVEGKTYERGDGVTWGGSEWHCHETTSTKPGDGSKAWTLKVKRGRDGRDGRDAPGAPPVVSVK